MKEKTNRKEEPKEEPKEGPNSEAKRWTLAHPERIVEVVHEALNPRWIEAWSQLGRGFRKTRRIAELLHGEDRGSDRNRWIGYTKSVRTEPRRWKDAIGCANFTFDDRDRTVELVFMALREKKAGSTYAFHNGEGLSWVVELLASVPVNSEGRSALAEVVEAVRPVARQIRDILTPLPAFKGGAVVKVSLPPERERGKLLAGLVPFGEEPKPGILPMYPDPPEAIIHRVPLLSMVDASGAPIMAQGQGAPLGLRIPVECLLAISNKDRKTERATIAITVGELERWLFPRKGFVHKGGGKRPSDWSRTREALLGIHEQMIRLPGDGTVIPRYWRLVILRGEPGRDCNKNDKIIFDIAVPPGAASGPEINRMMMRILGARSAPKYRAFIAVQCASWRLGGKRGTRSYNPRAKTYSWSTDPTRYPIYNLEDRRRLAFGPDSHGRTIKKVDEAFEDTDGVEVLDKAAKDERTGKEGWRIVPAKAKEIIEEAAAKAEEEKAKKEKAKKNR